MAEASPALPLRLVLSMALASGLAPLNSTMISVVIRPMGITLSASESLVTQAVVTSYLVTAVVMQAPGGKLGDALGHRRVLTLGQIVFALAAALAIVSPNLAWLAFARVSMAAAGALVVPSAVALLRTELPPSQRGRAFGAFGAVMAFSASVGPLLGGKLAGAFGWRSVFAANLVLLPISYLLAGRAKDEERAPRARVRFDYLGTVVLAGMLSSFVLGAARRPEPHFGLLVLSAFLFVAFVLVERRAAEPVVTLSLFQRPVFVASGLVIALHNFAMYALLFELPTVMGIVLGTGPSRIGPLLAALTVPMVVVSPFAGRLIDAVGARVIALTGACVAIAGMVAISRTALASSLPLSAALAVFGAGLGLSSAPAQSAAMSAVPKELSGSAAGTSSTMRYLGGVGGTLALTLVLPSSRDPAETLAAHGRILQMFIGALVLAALASLALPRAKTPDAVS